MVMGVHMDNLPTPLVFSITAGLLLVGMAWALARFTGLVALIRLSDGMQDKSVWQIWKRWLRAGLLGWTKAAWRLANIQMVVFLAMLPLFIPCLACAGAPLFGGIFSGDLSFNEPVSYARILVVILLVLLILIILSIPLSLVGPYVQIAQRAVVLDGLGVFPALRRGWEVARGHSADVFTLWLVGALLSFAFWLVVLPLVGILAVGGMVAAWVFGAGVYGLIAQVLEAQISFFIAVSADGLLFLIVLFLPVGLLDGLMSTAMAVSWTRAYRKFCPVLQSQNELRKDSGQN